jgi:hypothetical protein
VDYTATKDPNVADQMVLEHVLALRRIQKYSNSLFIVGIESNYGGAQGAKRVADALVPTDSGTYARQQAMTNRQPLGAIQLIDNDKEGAGVPGAWTSPAVKEGAARLLTKSLERKSLVLGTEFVTQQKNGRPAVLHKICEQLGNFRDTPKPVRDPIFGKPGHVLSGKAGGQKDDVCVCIQLNLWWRQLVRARPQFRDLCRSQGIEL